MQIDDFLMRSRRKNNRKYYLLGDGSDLSESANSRWNNYVDW